MNDAPAPPAGSPPLRAAAPVPPGSRLECARLVLALLTDLASTPWHLVVFVFTRGSARRQLAAALAAPVTSTASDP